MFSDVESGVVITDWGVADDMLMLRRAGAGASTAPSTTFDVGTENRAGAGHETN